MGSVKDNLDRLREETSKLSKIKLKGNNTQVVDSLIARKRSKVIRDGDEYEKNLVRFYMNEGNIIEKLKSDLILHPISPGKEDTERVLDTAKTINQICCSTTVEERIAILEQNYNERQINLNYLEDTLSKNEADIDILTRSNTEQNTMNIDEPINTTSGDDVRDEELVIKRLEQEISQKRSRAKLQSSRKSENLNIHQELSNLSTQQHIKLKQGASDAKILEKIGNLEQEIRTKRKRLTEYDTMLQEINKNNINHSSLDKEHHHKQATTREVYTGLRARIEKLLNDNGDMNNDATSSNDVQELVSTFESIETQVKDILERLATVEKCREMHDMSRYIYYKLCTWIHHRAGENNNNNNMDMDQFNTLFPHNTTTTTDETTIPKETLLSTAILMKLHDDGDIPLATLDEYVGHVAKQYNLSEETSSQAIYTLAAAQLVSIDRSHKDSLVKLNLYK